MASLKFTVKLHIFLSIDKIVRYYGDDHTNCNGNANKQQFNIFNTLNSFKGVINVDKWRQIDSLNRIKAT